MGKIPGYKIVLQFDSKTIVGYRSHSMDAEADLADATTGASTDQWKEVYPMFKGMKFSVAGLFDPTAGDNSTFEDAYDLLANGTKFTAKYGNTEAGSRYYSVDCYVNAVHIEGPHDDLSSYTLDCTATGKPTPGVVGA